MLTRCSFPDCKAPYKIEFADKVKSYLVNGICPKCHRLGRAKPIEVIDKIAARQRHNSKVDNTSGPPIAKGQFFALLEDIRSSWNVGSIFRTADAVGISQLYLSGITGCPPSKEIAKTALGAEQSIAWEYICHPLDIISVLKASGITIVGLERNSNSTELVKLLKEKVVRKPLCLVIGNENAGLSPETIEYCDYICDLPMKGKKESLNVASAFAVAAYFIDEFA